MTPGGGDYLVAELVSECGGASGLSLEDHLRIIEAHAGGTVVDAVLVHEGAIDSATLGRCAAEGASPLNVRDSVIVGPHVVRRNLLVDGPKLRHDSGATASGLLAAWAELSRRDEGRRS